MILEKTLKPAVLILIFMIPSVVAAMPQITGDVETEFGIYSPYSADFTPDVPPYVIAPDLNTVTNKDKFTFTESEKALLARNGFVAQHSQFKQVYDVYNYCQDNDIPIFVTTDSVLHIYHILFDYTLRILETQEFYDDLEKLNEIMLDRSIAQYEIATDARAKTSAMKNMAYFAVASVLINPAVEIPVDVMGLVEAELDLIDAHVGKANSPIFGYAEDYSQYVPRGHYTRSDLLERYFKSMMWYGRMMFRLKPREGEEKAKEETLQAILIVSAVADAAMTQVWDRIYEPTVFFVGRTDDLNIYDYMELATDIYGDGFGALSPDDLADEAKLEDFIAEAKELPSPLINSSFVFETEDLDVTKGFRFMGQRFIPDSYMFQELVHTAVSNRMFPKGLDVMAILGSERAYDILLNVYGENRFPKYVEQIAKLRGEFGDMDDEMWAQNLYWNWLYTLMPLLTPKEGRYPSFMLNKAWENKELATALGSWAELRHDTILYAKQSYAMETSMPMPPPLVKGYVEPNPEFYARLASLSKFTREGLSARGLLLPEFSRKFSQLEELLVSLKEIAEIELECNPLDSSAPAKYPSREQYGLINNIGGTLEEIATFPPEIAGQIEGDEDDEMAIIADVHTDPNSAQVLEEGVGYPLNLFVVVPVNGGLRISQGPMFSYYEFTWAMSDRLTDGAWQEMLKNNPPKLPEWMKSFTHLEIQQPGAHFSFQQKMSWQPARMDVTVEPDAVEIGAKIEIQAAIHGAPGVQPRAVLKQANRTAETVMKLESAGFVSEYTAVLDTANFEPGTALLTVSGSLGEEEIIYTEEVAILAKPSAVESADHESTGSGESLSPENRVHNAYPNPFNPDVWIPYELKRGTDVTVSIYNVLGQLVRTLDMGYRFPGKYISSDKAVHWNGKNSVGEQVASGIYFYRLKAGDFVATGRMIAVK